jgi:hypothetical protein
MCASCHQFNFPVLGDGGELDHYTALPMQNTVAEHRQSQSRLACTGCHMKDGHRFLGSHDRDTLRRSLDISLCRQSGTVTLTLENRGAAHNVPSGGVHRHVAITAWRSSSPAGSWTTRLGRTFGPDANGSKKLLSDTTLAPGRARRFQIAAARFGGRRDEPINVRFEFVFQAPDRVDSEHAPEPALNFWERRFRLSDLPRCSP